MTNSARADFKGLLYDQDSLRLVERIFGDLGADEFRVIYRNSWTLGLKTPFKDGTLCEVAADLLAEARRSLKRQFQNKLSDSDESHFLNSLDELVQRNETLAERLLSRWQGSQQEKLAVLIDHCGYGQKRYS